MSNPCLKKLTKCQVGALRECVDLEVNGYRLVFRSFMPSLWYWRFVHNRNGRRLTVKWSPDEFTVSEGGKVLKHIDSKLNVISD